MSSDQTQDLVNKFIFNFDDLILKISATLTHLIFSATENKKLCCLCQFRIVAFIFVMFLHILSRKFKKK